MVPAKDPRAAKKKYPCPYPLAMTFENVKRVADYWCGGRCEDARQMPAPRFNQILGVVIAKEMGAEIEAQIQAQERAAANRKSSLRG